MEVNMPIFTFLFVFIIITVVYTYVYYRVLDNKIRAHGRSAIAKLSRQEFGADGAEGRQIINTFVTYTAEDGRQYEAVLNKNMRFADNTSIVIRYLPGHYNYALYENHYASH